MDTDVPDEDRDSEQEALDRLRLDARSASRPDPGLVRSILQDQAERLWAASLLEKGVMLGGLALASVGLFLVAVSLFGSSSSDGAGVLLAADSRTPEQSAATDTPTQMPAATSQPVPTTNITVNTLPTSTPPAAAISRENCLEIRGTQYLSPLERTWYVANCQTEVLRQSDPVASPTSEPPRLSPTPQILSPTPVREDTFSADDAIESGAAWISLQAEAGHEVDRASCTASDLGSVWLVSCRTFVPGCQSAVCEAWISACVTEPDGAILPAKLC